MGLDSESAVPRAGFKIFGFSGIAFSFVLVQVLRLVRFVYCVFIVFHAALNDFMTSLMNSARPRAGFKVC